jgi:hypothetical protein
MFLRHGPLPLRLLTLAVCFVTLIPTATLKAQDVNNDARTSSYPVNGRYEILQSALAARWTFKLDRFTGNISMLVHDKNNDFTWDAMPVLNKGAGQDTRPHFQIYLSGISALFSFMVDTDTGRTWQLVHRSAKNADGGTEEEDVWQSFPE